MYLVDSICAIVTDQIESNQIFFIFLSFFLSFFLCSIKSLTFVKTTFAVKFSPSHSIHDAFLLCNNVDWYVRRLNKCIPITRRKKSGDIFSSSKRKNAKSNKIVIEIMEHFVIYFSYRSWTTFRPKRQRRRLCERVSCAPSGPRCQGKACDTRNNMSCWVRQSGPRAVCNNINDKK